MRRIRTAWRELAVAEINRHPFNPRARYADLKNKKEIVYFAAMAYRSQLNSLYRETMKRKRTSQKLLNEINVTARSLASIALYEMEHQQ
jgi:hypothetical protein